MNPSKTTTKLCMATLLVVLIATLLCLSIGAESDGALISYQVTEGTGDVFSLRVIAGVNSLNYEKFGYEIILTTKDIEGNDVTEMLTGETTLVYSSVYGGGSYHSIKDNFGYEYAALATVKNLAIHSKYTKLEIRTYVVPRDGNAIYNTGTTLLYTGLQTENGYPALSFDRFLYSGICGAEGDNLIWGLTDEGALLIRGTGNMQNYAAVSDTPWYSYSSSIKTVTIQNGVSGIGDRAFFGCSNLTSVTVPDSVTSVGFCAFNNSSKLAEVTAEACVTSIDWNEFRKQ